MRAKRVTMLKRSLLCLNLKKKKEKKGRRKEVSL